MESLKEMFGYSDSEWNEFLKFFSYEIGQGTEFLTYLENFKIDLEYAKAKFEQELNSLQDRFGALNAAPVYLWQFV